jgi:hypothetical protein
MSGIAIRVGVLAGVALSPAAVAQVIYDNGPLATGAMHSTGIAAPPGWQWSEVQPTNTTTGFGAQRYADDFTLSGSTQIASVDVYAFVNGSGTVTSPFTSMTLRIWDGPPNSTSSNIVFGNTTTNRLASSTLAMVYRTLGDAADTNRPVWVNRLTIGATLPAGTYWLDWGASTGQVPPVTIVGQLQKPGSNAMYFSTAIGFWRDAKDGSSQAVQDYPFVLSGSGSGSSCYANCDGSTNVPLLNVADFTCFLQKFAGGCASPSPCYANCDGSTGAPFLNVADFTCFLQRFAGGCSAP